MTCKLYLNKPIREKKGNREKSKMQEHWAKTRVNSVNCTFRKEQDKENTRQIAAWKVGARSGVNPVPRVVSVCGAGRVMKSLINIRLDK